MWIWSKWRWWLRWWSSSCLVDFVTGDPTKGSSENILPVNAVTGSEGFVKMIVLPDVKGLYTILLTSAGLRSRTERLHIILACNSFSHPQTTVKTEFDTEDSCVSGWTLELMWLFPILFWLRCSALCLLDTVDFVAVCWCPQRLRSCCFDCKAWQELISQEGKDKTISFSRLMLQRRSIFLLIFVLQHDPLATPQQHAPDLPPPRDPDWCLGERRDWPRWWQGEGDKEREEGEKAGRNREEERGKGGRNRGSDGWRRERERIILTDSL